MTAEGEGKHEQCWVVRRGIYFWLLKIQCIPSKRTERIISAFIICMHWDLHIIIEWHSLPCAIACSCHESVLINNVYCIRLLEQIEEHRLSYLCRITHNPVVVNASILLLWDLSLVLSPTVLRLCSLCFVRCGFYTSLRVRLCL